MRKKKDERERSKIWKDRHIGEKSILRVLKMDYYRKCGSRFTKESDFFFFFFLIESWVERSMTRRIKENVTENTVGLARECTPTNRWKNTSRSVLIKKQLDDQTIFYFRKFIQLFRGKNKNFLFFFPSNCRSWASTI